MRTAQHKAASELQVAPAKDEANSSTASVAPVVDMSPIAIRGRFKSYKSLEFASEVIRQIQSLHEARDHRGRPRIVPRDVVVIVNAAVTFVEMLASNRKDSTGTTDRFTSSPRLRSLVAAANRSVLGREIQEFDPTHPERFLALADIDERIQAECLSLLQQALAEPEVSTALSSLIDSNTSTTETLDNATASLLGCGCDRRTLIFVPRGEAREAESRNCATSGRSRASCPPTLMT